MSDYTSRCEAIKALDTALRCGAVVDYSGIEAAIDIIRDLPAADVRPVVRGKWETVMLDHERMGCRPTAHYCSECHQITWFRTFFCPSCGADMREEQHDNQR